MHCYEVNCSQCKHDAVVSIFGQQFFQQDEDAKLLWLLQQPVVHADVIAQYLKTHPHLVLQPHHFCALCKHGSQLNSVKKMFLKNVLDARRHSRSLVRAGVQYSVALQMWKNVPAHIDIWLAKSNRPSFPTTHWCCEQHKEEAFWAIKEYITTGQSAQHLPHILRTAQPPSTHPLPA